MSPGEKRVKDAVAKVAGWFYSDYPESMWADQLAELDELDEAVRADERTRLRASDEASAMPLDPEEQP